jgi:hypothetical protein
LGETQGRIALPDRGMITVSLQSTPGLLE